MLLFGHFYCVHCVHTVNIVFTIHWIWCIHCVHCAFTAHGTPPSGDTPLLMPPWWYPSVQTPPQQTSPMVTPPSQTPLLCHTSPVRHPPRQTTPTWSCLNLISYFLIGFIYSEKRSTHTDLKSSNRMKISWLEPELWPKM